MQKLKLMRNLDEKQEDTDLMTILNNYKKLNGLGKAKLIDYLCEVLVSISKYTGTLETVTEVKEKLDNVIYVDFKMGNAG